MKRININHLRAIKKFSKSNKKFKISDYEKFLNDYVSIPTARKIIKEIVEMNIVSGNIVRRLKERALDR